MADIISLEKNLSIRQHDYARLGVILAIFFVLEVVFGISLYFVNPSRETSDFFDRIGTERTARLLIINKNKPLPKSVMAEKKPEPKNEPEKKTEPKKEVIDLTHKPLLNQKQDMVVKKVVQLAPNQTAGSIPRLNVAVLGTGGGLGNAVRFGQVANAAGYAVAQSADTMVISLGKLQGPLVSTTTITAMPKLIVEVKPAYTKEMLEHHVTGIVRAKLLIDTDGTVKRIVLLEDLGYGSREAVFEAFKKLKFKPAMRGNEPVAVEIIMTYRFVLQN